MFICGSKTEARPKTKWRWISYAFPVHTVHESRFTNHDLDINIPCLYKHTFILLGGPDPAANFVKLAREKG